MGRLVSIIRGAGVALLFLLITLCLAITILPPFLDRIYYDGPCLLYTSPSPRD